MTVTRAAWWVPPVAAGLGILVGCSGGASAPPATFLDPGRVALTAFESCQELEGALREAAAAHVGPYGFGGRDLPDAAAEPDAAREAEPPAAAPAPGGDLPQDDPAAPPDHSSTNVHESGVDEPDVVKTDGHRIVVLTGGRLRVVDPASRVETGVLDVPGATAGGELLLAGDRALVLLAGGAGVRPGEPTRPGAEPARPGSPPDGIVATEPAPDPRPDPVYGPRMLLVDLTGEPRVIDEYQVEGSLLDARAVGPVARVVVRSAPRVSFPQSGRDVSDAERTAANRAAIAETPLADWLPRYRTGTGAGATTDQVDCGAVSRPADYSATSLLTVLTFDLAGTAGLGSGDPVTVVADGDTVYSNGSSLYIANDRRAFAPDGTGTGIYRFDTSQPGPPSYAAAGAVEGWLLNQYAMSEWDGHLRVATTTAGETTESGVTVLADRDGVLAEVGSVGGLGRTETIYAVRFVGPIGYVVTFRQTDPLYTVDLRDPAAPVVRGELEITGYSAYLHEIADGRLIGVGQEADTEGQILGSQVSLFDVADLTAPSVLDQHHVPFGHSAVEYDPHAFLWWPDAALLAIPLADGGAGAGVTLLRVEGDRLDDVGSLTHPAGGSVISRSLVIGDTLWTLSGDGLMATTLDTFAPDGWLPFT